MNDKVTIYYNKIIDYIENHYLSPHEAYNFALGYIRALKETESMNKEDINELLEEITSVLIGMFCKDDN